MSSFKIFIIYVGIFQTFQERLERLIPPKIKFLLEIDDNSNEKKKKNKKNILASDWLRIT